MKDELYQYLACDYYATGEGRTLCLLITRAYPRTDDYDENFELKDGHTAKVRAALEFASAFDSFYLQGAENLTREEFLQRYGNHLPPYIDKMLNPEPGEGPGNFNLKLQIHMNYS